MSTRRKQLWHVFLVCLVAATFPAGRLGAQAVTGTMSGTVTDQQGSVIPGATVTIISEATKDERPTVTDGRGEFQVTNLQPGSYTVTVELASFRTLERRNVRLSAAERLSVGTLALEVGSLGETVTVEARGAHVNTAETQHSGVITATQIEQTQVLGRDVTSIMRLLPGVRYENTVDSLGMSFGTSVPECRRRPPRLEQRHRRRRDRQRGRQQRPDGPADQPRRHRRGAGAAQLVPRGIRARRRRPGPDRQQERRLVATAAISTTTAATRR